MSRQQYCELIDELCEELGGEDPRSRYDDCHLRVNQIAFTIMHGDHINEDGLFIYSDFGEIPAVFIKPALRHLLETNLFLYGHNKPGFGTNPETGRVLLMLRVPLSDANLDSLIQVMANIATYAKAWRQAFHLADPAREQELLDRISTPVPA